MGSFDTHALQEFEKNGVVLTGTDYQRGQRYGMATLREAALYRQNYICPLCSKTLIGRYVSMHHLGYRIKDRSNRLDNVIMIHTSEHTPANHRPGGKLYDLEPETTSLKSAAFMNSVRYQIIEELMTEYPDVTFVKTYGAETKMKRRDLGIQKSHANDAYAMGEFHPKHRSDTGIYVKMRRNNRVLEKFYDAKYIDIRDGKVKKGADIGSNRTNRRVPRNNPDNLRQYRGAKVSKGRVSIRRQRYSIRPGDTVVYRGKDYKAKGVQCNGTRLVLETGKSVKITDVAIKKKVGGWQFLQV